MRRIGSASAFVQQMPRCRVVNAPTAHDSLALLAAVHSGYRSNHAIRSAAARQARFGPLLRHACDEHQQRRQRPMANVQHGRHRRRCMHWTTAVCMLDFVSS